MALINYSKPMDFCERAEAVSVVVQFALVQLRDYAEFHEDEDVALVRAAESLSSVLEDAKAEVERLLDMIEVK